MITWITKRTEEHEKRAREQAQGLNEQQAQTRMFTLTEQRNTLEKAIETLNGQIETAIEEARALLEQYPGLLFRRPK